MTAEELLAVIAPHCQRRTFPSVPPAAEHWHSLSQRFATTFPPELITLHQLLSTHHIPGGWLAVASGPNDTIADTYEHEVNDSDRDWDPDLLPIYDVGNGDYYCLRVSEGAESAVYFICHEDDSIEQIAPTFARWVSDPELFP